MRYLVQTNLLKLVLIYKIRTVQNHWKHLSELHHQGEQLHQDLGLQPQEEVELQLREFLQEGLQQERQLLELHN